MYLTSSSLPSEASRAVFKRFCFCRGLLPGDCVSSLRPEEERPALGDARRARALLSNLSLAAAAFASTDSGRIFIPTISGSSDSAEAFASACNGLLSPAVAFASADSGLITLYPLGPTDPLEGSCLRCGAIGNADLRCLGTADVSGAKGSTSGGGGCGSGAPFPLRKILKGRGRCCFGSEGARLRPDALPRRRALPLRLSLRSSGGSGGSPYLTVTEPLATKASTALVLTRRVILWEVT